MDGEYLLKRHIGVMHWARVLVVATPAENPLVQVSSSACGWLAERYGPGAVTDVPAEYRAAAESGATLALAQASEPLAVTVTTIEFTHVDTTPDDVRTATFHAVARAIGSAPADSDLSAAELPGGAAAGGAVIDEIPDGPGQGE